MDFKTALKILDPDIYNNNAVGFVNIINNVKDSDEFKEYKNKKLNEDLKNFSFL